MDTGQTVRLILSGPDGGGGGGDINALQMVSDLNRNGASAVSSNSSILYMNDVLTNQDNGHIPNSES